MPTVEGSLSVAYCLQVMKGYLNRPDATAETIDSEGYLHTGDVGIVDKNGFLTIVDRVKELIKFRGLQVHYDTGFCALVAKS